MCDHGCRCDASRVNQRRPKVAMSCAKHIEYVPDISRNCFRTPSSASGLFVVFYDPSLNQGGGKGAEMSIQVLHAHTGSLFRSNVDSFSSLDDFRSWIARKTSIQASNQILMTGKGKPVKFQSLATEQEVFLYDRDVLASSTSASRLFAASDHSLTPYNIPDPPDVAPLSEKLPNLQDAARKYEEWAQTALRGASETVEQITSLDRQTSNIQRATSIAVENIRQHLANLSPKHAETKAWADQISADQASVLQQWRVAYDSLEHLKVKSSFSRCLKEGVIALARAEKKHIMGDTHSLQDYIDYEELIQVDAAAKEVGDGFAIRLKDLNITHRAVERDAQATVDNYEQSTTMLDSDLADQASRLLEEVDVLAKKISTDCDRIASFTDDSKSRGQATRIVQMHSNHFAPSIVQTVDEIAEVGKELSHQKKNTVQTTTHHLQKISSIESRISSLHSKLAKLDVDPESEELFNILDFPIRLPAVYGLYLVEYIRRSEVAEKVGLRDDTRGLEQEKKRQAQFVKSVGGVLEFTESANTIASGLPYELSLPTMARKDLDQYLAQLSSTSSFQDAGQEIQEAVKLLDTASKRQSVFATAFKNGSIHEAGNNRDITTAPLAQSVQTLQKEKAKVDEKLKSAESRIRKLEDLLHRQSQMPRPPSANGFSLNHAPSFERQVTSPVTNFTSALSNARALDSRRSSTSSRRVSQNLDPEEKGLTQRIVNLEAELMGQRELVKEMKKDHKARKNAEEMAKQQALEAISTKEDLLVNMETQQREFDDERRLAREENATLNARLEEAEDELDRALGSTEHDTKISLLQEEVDQLRVHIQELEQARRDAIGLYQSQTKSLERANKDRVAHNAELESTISNLTAHNRAQEETSLRQHAILQSTLRHLSTDVVVSKDQSELPAMLESLARSTALYQEELQSSLDQLREEKASADTDLEGQRKELLKVRGFLEVTEDRADTLDQQLAVKSSENKELQSRLESATEEKDNLSSMFKSSEAEVEALNQQLTSQVTKYDDLHARFGSLQGFHGELDDQLRDKGEALAALQQKHDEASDHHYLTRDRAEIISKKLQLQIEGLRKLVEAVGLMITHQDSKMVIQKAPKQPPTSASTTLLDPSASMRRSISGPLPFPSDIESLIPTDEPTLHWATAPSPTSSSTLYTRFLSQISTFDLQVFSEAIHKRVKEIEHIARKWQREAKLYREKSHRFQSEVHERIALRSFKEGDLALFLPTRDQATKPWAAFNVGAPHYFLRETEGHKLGKRDWLIARITRVEERVVDLSKNLTQHTAAAANLQVPNPSQLGAQGVIDDNPYHLSDGLRWYLVDAHEEKPGAPISVAQGKATVALTAPNKEEEMIRGSMSIAPINVSGRGKPSAAVAVVGGAGGTGGEASRTLARSLDSRRSSTNSRKSWIGGVGGVGGGGGGGVGGASGLSGTSREASGVKETGPGAGVREESLLRRTNSGASHHSQRSRDEREREPSRMQAVHSAADETGGTDADDPVGTTTDSKAPPEWMHQIWEG